MIAWFTRNPVAANLLMLAIFVAGVQAVVMRTPLEVFPSTDADRVQVITLYRGASPEEVEKAVSTRVEEAIQDLQGIEEIRSYSTEGQSRVDVDVARGHHDRELLDDIKGRVEAITSFPEGIERPEYRVVQWRRNTISAVVYGALPEAGLRRIAERVRDEIAALAEVTQVELDGVRPYELAIEIPEARLREYGLTLAEVAEAIRRGSLDLAAGSLLTAGGEILVSARQQAVSSDDFAEIVLRGESDGSRLLLGDIARISDGFTEDPVVTRFDGRSAVLLEVYRVGDQSAIEVAGAVKRYIAEAGAQLPEGVTLAYWRDRSRIVEARLDTLLRSAAQGMALVLLLLALFLRPAVALWVCVGIPIAFAGGLLLMPTLGITLNIVTLFAFILVLGIVVDDAIVTGENVHARLEQWGDPLRAAIEGTREVAVPVTFGVLTTAVAFLPPVFMGGHRGPIFAQIPLVVVPVLLFSLVESKLILPAHLRYLKPRDPAHPPGRLLRGQQRIADGLQGFIMQFYRPLLHAALNRRYLTLSLFIAVVIVVFSAVGAGWMKFVFFPRVQSELARASLSMPAGTPVEVTGAHIARMAETAQALQEKYVDPESGEPVIRHILSTVGSTGGRNRGQSHVGRVMFEIVAPEHRSLAITSSELVAEWRRSIGAIPGAESVTYRAEIGRGGDPIDVQLRGRDFAEMQALAEGIKARLAGYPGLFDIGDSYSDGKRELRLSLLPRAELIGLSLRDVAQQVRRAFLGEEVQRIQRDRDEVKVMLRYPLAERESLARLYDLRIRTPGGGELPLAEIAELQPARSPAQIKRIDRQRTINITADADKQRADVGAIKADLGVWLDDSIAALPGIDYSLEGEAREQRDSFGTLYFGLLLVLFLIYCLLAIPFRSYSQPLMVMSVMPFGVAGAVLGHAIMGMNLSIISALGMLALIGVVVNDSLVLVDYVNRRRREGVEQEMAVRIAGVARFRPVLLTSLTTFAGLTPLIFEKSTQAQFLIPMAVSLGFGILFATFVTLLLIPVNYLILEDIRRELGRFRSWLYAPRDARG